MSARNKIEKYNLGPEVLRLDALPGMTTYRIAELLTEGLQGKDTITQSTVSRWLKGERKERRDQTRSVVNERLKKEVPKDLDALEEVQAWLMGIFRDQRELIKLNPEWEKDPEIKALMDKIQGGTDGGHDLRTRIDAAMKAVKVVEVKLKYAGILEDPLRPKALDDLTDDELKERMEQIGR